MGIQKASLQIDSQGKFNLSLNPSYRDMQSAQLCLGQAVFGYQENNKNKIENKRIMVRGPL